MNRRTLLIVIGAAVVIAGAGYWYWFGGDEPDPVSLEEAVAGAQVTTTITPGAAGTQAPTTTAGATTTTAEGATTAPGATGEVAGIWTVDPTNTFAGYRVDEELASFGANTAVGRTDQVQGEVVIDGGSVTGVDITVDMTTLRSDNSMRDGALRSRGLQSGEFPQATFTLTEPVDLGGEPAVGDVLTVTMVGDLTIRDVTRNVEVTVDAQYLDEDTIVAVGSVDLLTTDFEIDLPTSSSVLSIDENAVMEFQLQLARQ